MRIHKILLLVPVLLAGCDSQRQWVPPANPDFIDLSEGEIPEFKKAVEEARASVDELKMLIERDPNSQIHVLLFFAEAGVPRYVWAKLDLKMLDAIDYPFQLIEVHPKWKEFRIGQHVAMTKIELIYDWRATVDGKQRGNFTKFVLSRMNSYYL